MGFVSLKENVENGHKKKKKKPDDFSDVKWTHDSVEVFEKNRATVIEDKARKELFLPF